MSTPQPQPPPLPFNVDNTLGALLIGGLFAAAFWGVTSIQTYIYYQRYPNDRLALKLVVALLWILDTFDVCLTSHIGYHYLVTNYMNPEAIAAPVWSLIIHATTTIFTDVLVRCMFSKRVWGISNRSIMLTSVVWIISLGDLIIGILITVKAFQLESMTQLKVLAPLFYASFVTSFTGDLYLSVVLCYYLFKSRTGFRRTDTLLNTLLSYIITTGLLTSCGLFYKLYEFKCSNVDFVPISIDAALGTIFYGVMPTNYIFVAFYFNLAKCKLNARQRLRQCDGPVSIRLSGISSDPRFATGFTESTAEHSPQETHEKATHRDVDLEIAVHTTVDRREDYTEARAL
ncbi:hypothetical protein OG21DRAFT_1486033 [Imleria badia]|nr:hypothetical protein OG21DRAFT_1486033 [Imleria badia]